MQDAGCRMQDAGCRMHKIVIADFSGQLFSLNSQKIFNPSQNQQGSSCILQPEKFLF
jgi:hypothetical protein